MSSVRLQQLIQRRLVSRLKFSSRSSPISFDWLLSTGILNTKYDVQGKYHVEHLVPKNDYQLPASDAMRLAVETTGLRISNFKFIEMKVKTVEHWSTEPKNETSHDTCGW